MNKLVEKYGALSFEQKTVLKTVVGLCFSFALALSKLVIGLFTDYNLVSIALYTFALLLAKCECVFGLKGNEKSFQKRNILTAAFLFLASVIYVGFMVRMFFIERRIKNNGMVYVLLLACISFCELGFAIAGLYRMKSRGHHFRNIKIINFCVALIAILTTQMAILNMESETGVVDIANAYTGIAVGCFIALCAVYILIAPKTSVAGREHQKFILTEPQKNTLFDMEKESGKLILCKSAVYGDFLFSAKIEAGSVEGDIVRGKSLWRRMHIVWKILCCILSEILVFVWLIGRGVLFFRSMCLPQRLAKKMKENGFQLCK